MNIEEVPQIFDNIKTELSKVIIGQEDVMQKLFISLLCKGHVLLVGVPGLAKTTLVNSFSEALGLKFNRVQFTPDLMPSDILGTEILQEKGDGGREFVFNEGPIFSNLLLADEINRTPPKTQSALLQAMQEKKVTVSGKTTKLDEPFMVLATQNPVEQEGTYPLPEAQLDRFLFSITLEYPSEEEELTIVKKHSVELTETIKPVVEKEKIIELQKILYNMTVSDHVYEHAVKLVRSTRPVDENKNKLVNEYVSWGAGPRATTYLILAAKGQALIEGRPTPTEADISNVAHTTLNHRILLNFQAEAENITNKEILKSIDIS